MQSKTFRTTDEIATGAKRVRKSTGLGIFPEGAPSLLKDLLVFLATFSVFFAFLAVTRYWLTSVNSRTEIDLRRGALPAYAMFSFMRIAISYVISLVFSVVYGYVAAYNTKAERVMITLLDTLQSIPLLSFLPGVMLAMVALFPRRQFGIELVHTADFFRTGVEYGL